jgi:hypothetical protein
VINILKANELPPGARIMGRQGRALNGVELASGLLSLIESKVGQWGAEAAQKSLNNEWWPSLHLTFPRAFVEWCDCQGDFESTGIWLRALLGNGIVWEFRWNDENADIRELQKLGPFGTPDDMRDALGLPRIAQFKLPSGEIVTAELPGEHLRPSEPRREEILAQIAEVPQLIAKPSDDIEVVRKEAGEAVDRMQAKPTITGGFVSDFSNRYDTPKEELLAEPPTVETTPAPPKAVEPPKKAGLRKAVAKGGKK